MALLSAADAEQVRKLFSTMTSDVHLRLYTQRLNCDTCLEAERILSELSEQSDRLKVEVLNALTDAGRREADGVENVPALIVGDGSHGRIRFYGTPSGYEFSTLLTVITDAGTPGDRLEKPALDFLSSLAEDLLIRVFVTPTCPYCPRAAVTAARMAAASPRVRAEIIEANEFPDLSRRFRVQGVPRTVVNDLIYLEGALPEAAFARGLGLALPLLAKGEPVDMAALLSKPREEEESAGK
ncbi:glutaredoxin [Candidatus Fermentibacteria bacterium]|nr:glutaredoxin [Candidatus Fermentibacteria bacterium]